MDIIFSFSFLTKSVELWKEYYLSISRGGNIYQAQCKREVGLLLNYHPYDSDSP